MTTTGTPTLFVFGEGTAVLPGLEVRDRSFEPSKNWRQRQGDHQLRIKARRDCSAWQPDGVIWLP